MNLLRKFFNYKNKIQTKLFKGDYYKTFEDYTKFLSENSVDIKATSLCQDFSEYGNTKQFILIITYKLIK